MFRKSFLLKLICFLFAVIFINPVFADGYIKDGIYAFDYERVLLSVDVATMYKDYGINARYDSVKIATGAAVLVKDSTFVDPESGIIVRIGAGGKIKSPDNSSIQGEYKRNGKISFFGTYTENNQTVQITLEGTLVSSADNVRAGSNFDGVYYATDPGTNKKQIIWIENGLYMWKYENAEADDFSGWPMIVNKDGSFNYQSEYINRAIMYGMSETYINSKTYSSGKFEPDGSLKLKIITVNSGTGQQEKEVPFTYSAVKASEINNNNGKGSVYTALDEGGNKKRRSKSAAVFGADKAEGIQPEWYNEIVVVSDDGFIACGKKQSPDSGTSLKIAEATAVSQIVAYLGTDVATSTEASAVKSDTENKKVLYRTLENFSLKNTQYEVLKKSVDEQTGWAYVQVQMKK